MAKEDYGTNIIHLQKTAAPTSRKTRNIPSVTYQVQAATPNQAKQRPNKTQNNPQIKNQQKQSLKLNKQTTHPKNTSPRHTQTQIST
jgi:hypothetical protein